MSVRATKWAWSLTLPTTVKFVLIALADHADDDGECWPSQSRIAEMTGLTDRTVRYVLHGLSLSGLVKTGGGKGHRGHTSLALEVEEITDDLAQIIAKECVSTSKKKGVKSEGRPHEIPNNRNEIPNPHMREIPMDRNLMQSKCSEIPIHRTTKNHQDPSIPPLSPIPKPKLSLVASKPDPEVQPSHENDTPSIPDFIPLEAWNAFLGMRKAKRIPNTPRAIKLLIGNLEKFHAAGHHVGEILDISTMRGWTGVFEPKEEHRSGGYTGKPKSALAQQAERMRQQWSERCS